MSLLSVYGDDIEADIQRQLKNPRPDAGTDFRTWSALSSGVKGIPAAGLEVGGSLLDFLAPAAIESARHKRPAVLGDQPDDSARRAADLAFVQQGGDTMRAKAAEFTPDPITSTTADQTLFGLSRIGTKAALAVTAGGPIGGGALLASEETNTQYRALIAKGIDPATALKVAAAEGMTAGASVAVPMVGPTVKSTLALMGITGPGAYMAQEALAKDILAKAGYHDEASLHNPADPLGLALSTALPGAFGALHIAGLTRTPPPTLADVAMGMESGGKRYGKDGQLLTSPKGAQGEMQVMPKTAIDPGFGVIPAKDASPEELARVGRDYLAAMQHRYGQPDLALAAYNAGPGAVDKAMLHGDDWLKHLPDETQKYVAKGMTRLGDQVVAHGAADPAAVDAARVRTTNDALNRSMPEHPEAHAEVMRASDEIAAGEMPTVRPVERLESFMADDANINQDARAYTIPTVEAMAEAQRLVGPERFEALAAPRAEPRPNDTEIDPATRVEMVARKIVDFHDKGFTDEPVAMPRSQGTNALPHPESLMVETPKVAARAEPVQSPVAQRIAQLVKESPDLRVKLPGTDETLSVAVAHERAEAEHKLDASESDLVKAALDCAMGF